MIKSKGKDGLRYFKGTKVENLCSVQELFTCFIQKCSKNHLHRGESHTFYEMVVILDGTAKFTVGRNVYWLQENQGLFFLPGDFHTMYDEDGSAPRMLVISFSAKTFPECDRYFHLTDEDRELILSAYRAIDASFEIVTLESLLGVEEDPARSFRASVSGIKEGERLSASLAVKSLETFILKIASAGSVALSAQKNQERDYYGKILSVMEEHISEHLSCPEIASLCKISISLVEKTMFKHLGCGTMKYYNMLRMQKALNLLEKGSSVKEVSEALGFESQSYFSTVFKRHYGCTPSYIRNGGILGEME